MKQIFIEPINKDLKYRESLEIFKQELLKEVEDSGIPENENCIGRNDNVVAFMFIKETNHLHFLVEYDHENEEFYAITLDFLTFTRQPTYISIFEIYARKNVGSEIFQCKTTIKDYLKTLKKGVDN
ncbi:hypothetical protein [Aliarcobacter butzleri]|uniref:hypothetical protein n=1 Tax=Aliarcobacter butzleri TaxID=28197 RepID=UPI0021B4B71A|nr:hypothetical protein [Aliarcobacter butzleri]MCT7596089.1 hypothetical protein [Aliarcobacter butzleri]